MNCLTIHRNIWQVSTRPRQDGTLAHPGKVTTCVKVAVHSKSTMFAPHGALRVPAISPAIEVAGFFVSEGSMKPKILPPPRLAFALLATTLTLAACGMSQRQQEEIIRAQEAAARAQEAAARAQAAAAKALDAAQQASLAASRAAATVDDATRAINRAADRLEAIQQGRAHPSRAVAPGGGDKDRP